jgi:hypothetical protein
VSIVYDCIPRNSIRGTKAQKYRHLFFVFCKGNTTPSRDWYNLWWKNLATLFGRVAGKTYFHPTRYTRIDLADVDWLRLHEEIQDQKRHSLLLAAPRQQER